MKQKLLLPFVCAFALSAQTTAPAKSIVNIPGPNPAANAMQKSLELQQMSIRKQLPLEESRGNFFQLPPPATMGATAAAPMPVPKPDCKPLSESEVNEIVESAAEKQSLDPELLRGVMRTESGFVPCAVSPKGAQGLMQLMPATAQQLGVQDPFNPVQNVDGGAKLLKELLNRYGGDLGKALSAYNAGPSRVDAVNGIPQIPETQNYVQQILSLLPTKQ